MKAAYFVLGALGAHELYRNHERVSARKRAFDRASRRAAELRRPLVVVGDPDTGMQTRIARAYGCGDVCVDLTGCPLCPVGYARDLTKGVPEVACDSAVVFCSCVLEYVKDPHAAWREMVRMAGSAENVFLVTVHPVTFTGTLYPGARWWVQRDQNGGIFVTKVSWAAKAGLVAQLAGWTWMAIRR